MSAGRKLTSWLLLIVKWAAFAALLYAWKRDGVAEAGNVFQFWAWSSSIAGLVYFLAPTKPSETVTPHSPGQRRATDIGAAITLTALVWFGHFVLAVFWMLGRGGHIGYRERFDADGKFKGRA
jgi:hypothetical protein